MRTLQCIATTVCISSALFVTAAQQAGSPQQAVAPTTAAAKTFTQQLRNTVGFLEVDYLDHSELKSIAGTCFFVYLEDKRLGENQGFVYLVTNRHMADPGVEKGLHYPVERVLLRLNLKATQGETGSLTVPVPLGPTTHWYFPSDDATDLALLQATPNIDVFDYQTIPTSLFATTDQIRELAVDAGDPVVFAGFFYQFSGQKRIEPIVRQGVLAMMPGEELKTTLQKPGTLYLADAHAFHGNSGSPLFVSVGGIRHGTFRGDQYLLIGVISGYYPEGESFSVPAATVLTGEVHDNSGIATVVPAEELLKLLGSPELQSARDAQVSTQTKHP